jgi:hypothetical protein
MHTPYEKLDEVARKQKRHMRADRLVGALLAVGLALNLAGMERAAAPYMGASIDRAVAQIAAADHVASRA